jgi:putative ABC transport system permease protein
VTWSLALALARREGRVARRRLGLYGGTITLGVAALVAINAFRGDMADSVRAQSRTLLGADLVLRSNEPLPDSAERLLDSLETAGARTARMVRFSSMVLAPRSGLTRLIDVRGVGRGFPLYGNIETTPADLWGTFSDRRIALVDPAILVHLDVAPGDSIRIGAATFAVGGTIARFPGEMDIQAVVAPRVVIGARFVDETGLLRFGSRGSYEAYAALGSGADAVRFVEDHEAAFERWRVHGRTADWVESRYSETFDILARFLGLVGLIALLLGGLGVANAVHVFTTRRLDSVAMLRCLGADQRTVIAAYVLLAGAMSAVGAVAGAALGVAVQAILPKALARFLPMNVETVFRGGPVVLGLVIGVWVAAVFAALPILKLRLVSPLRALRRAVEPPIVRRDPWRWGAWGLIALSVFGLSAAQAPSVAIGLAFALGVAVAAGVLWGAARLTTRLLKRPAPRRLPYAMRQGVANLHRPHNQTAAVVLALGFGVFLLASLDGVRSNLVGYLDFTAAERPPDVAVFDIQPDQLDGTVAIVAAHGEPIGRPTPIVPARLAAINGRPVDSLALDSTPGAPSSWALRREYRHTYRDSLVGSESVLEGTWWTDDPAPDGPAGDTAAVSIEESVADELKVGLGDCLTWNVQGVMVVSRITSVRRVDWARFEPNFFFVFEPGVLDSAPRTFAILVRAGDPLEVARLQRDLVQRYSNLSSLDVSLVRQALDTIVGSVIWAIRFMAFFSLAAGLLVLGGAVATTRAQRVGEGVLLRTMGARAADVARVVAVEYASLGLLSGVMGAALSAVASWILMRWFFELGYRLPLTSLAGFAAATMLLATVVGFLGSREVLRRPPLAALRELAE